MVPNPYYDDKQLKPSQNISDSTDNVNNMAITYSKVTNDNLTINTDTNGTNDTNGQTNINERKIRFWSLKANQRTLAHPLRNIQKKGNVNRNRTHKTNSENRQNVQIILRRRRRQT